MATQNSRGTTRRSTTSSTRRSSTRSNSTGTRSTSSRSRSTAQRKRTPAQLERSLRQRRNKVQGLVKRNTRNLETTVKGATRDVRAGNFDRAAERVQTGVAKTAEDIRNQVPTRVV